MLCVAGTMDSNDSFSVVVEPGELGYSGLPRVPPPAHLPYPDPGYDPAGVLPHHPPFNTCGRSPP